MKSALLLDWTIALALIAVGCSQDTAQPEDEKDTDQTPAPSTADASEPEMPEMTADASSGAAGRAPVEPETPAAFRDRCLMEPCADMALPAQPELEFLEDMGDGWLRLVEIDWEMAAGSEGYRCKTFTVPEDVYVTAYAPQVPPGTHHVGFDISYVASLPDAVFACDVNGRGERKLQGSGVGSVPNELPPDVAMPLRAGEQLFMNLHLFNPRETPLSGRSGMWVKTVPAEEVAQPAEVVLVGPLMLDIPIGTSKHGSSCTIRADATVYGVSPHMHFNGVHARATVTTASGDEIVLHDGPFDPDEGIYYEVEGGGLQLEAGDRLNVECTYDNTTDGTLHWGDSALAEMCFINFSLYPALPYGNGPCRI